MSNLAIQFLKLKQEMTDGNSQIPLEFRFSENDFNEYVRHHNDQYKFWFGECDTEDKRQDRHYKLIGMFYDKIAHNAGILPIEDKTPYQMSLRLYKH